MTGVHRAIELEQEYEAEYRIETLKELPQVLKKIFT